MGIDITALDKLAIQEMIARFYVALEAGDPVGVAATFLEDGVLILREGDRTSAFSEFRGQPAIEAAVATYLSAKRNTRIRHCLSNFVMSPRDDSVDVGCAILAVNAAGGLALMGAAAGDFQVSLSDGQWLLCRFDHYLDSMSE